MGGRGEQLSEQLEAMREQLERGDTAEKKEAGGNALDPIAGAVRTYLWVPDGEPPPGWTMSRELSVAKLMMKHGEETPEIVEAIRGAAELRDTDKLGSLARPGEKMTMRIFTTAKSHGIPLYRLAMHRRRKHGGKESEAAAATISEALKAAAGQQGGS